MAYTNNPYCLMAQVVSALDLSSSAQQNDQNWIINDLIPEAQEAIDSYLGFSFQTDGTIPSPATRVYSGSEGDTLFMIERCVSFSQVLETFSSSSPSDITADCVLGPDNQVPGLYLKRKSGLTFTQGVQNYTVKGVFGRPSIPPAITRCCVRLTVAWYKMRDTNYSDFIIEGMVRQHYQRSIPDDIMQILDMYRPRIFRA